ncbi:MAG: hypothetical protein K8R24_13610 [Mycobacterium sp.]|nr:hypothetical protein [Mycobacterium sp.]
MPETTPPQPSPDAIDLTDLTDLADLADPVAVVVAVEMTTSFVRLCLCQTEPMVARLACNEATLRKPGGLELEKRTLSKELYRLIDRTVFRQLSAAVPLSHAEFALSRVETMLREQFAEIAGTAASYLLTDDRDTAIQMAAVAITMAAREVRAQVADVIAATRQRDEPEDEEA